MFEHITSPVYKKSEYPALYAQRVLWEKEKPFQGVRVLDNTPVFRNTLLKYDALISGGATLYVGASSLVPGDKNIYKELLRENISVVDEHTAHSMEFDVVLDCAGTFSSVFSRYGFVELTRSGLDAYANCKKPVFIADSSEIKRIETSLGTGESFFRALDYLNVISLASWNSKKLLVFGSGKVGSGLIAYALKYGASLKVVTDTSLDNEWKTKSEFIDFKNLKECKKAIVWADVIVTATGKKDALNKSELLEALNQSHAIFANMGVEDEYGNSIKEERILQAKKPLNFCLEEPTHLKFIDATMALHNALGLELLKRKCEKGVLPLPVTLEREILRVTRENGEIF